MSKEPIFAKDIILSLLDNDYYTLTQSQAIFHNYPKTIVEYLLFNRRNYKFSLEEANNIKEQIKSLGNLSFTEDELSWIRSRKIITEDFIQYLRTFKLNPDKEVFVEYNETTKELSIKIIGVWHVTVWYEIPILAIISEVISKKQSEGIPESNLIETCLTRFCSKLKTISDYNNFKFSDFGTRRRFSRKIQELIISVIVDWKVSYGFSNFNGTSNMYFAKKYNLVPIGTMSHQWIMAHQQMPDCNLYNFQSKSLDMWAREYKGCLGIALTDTIGIDSFLSDFNLMYSKLFDGVRHDSGDPIEMGEKVISHYIKHNIDPKTKTIIFSDGLDVDSALKILNYFDSRIQVAFGIGTNFTNDVLDIGTNSLVIKMVKCNNLPVIKISDSSGKEICIDVPFKNYVYHLYQNLINNVTSLETRNILMKGNKDACA